MRYDDGVDLEWDAAAGSASGGNLRATGSSLCRGDGRGGAGRTALPFPSGPPVSVGWAGGSAGGRRTFSEAGGVAATAAGASVSRCCPGCAGAGEDQWEFHGQSPGPGQCGHAVGDRRCAADAPAVWGRGSIGRDVPPDRAEYRVHPAASDDGRCLARVCRGGPALCHFARCLAHISGLCHRRAAGGGAVQPV